MEERIPAARVRRQITLLLHKWGMPPDLTATTAEVMVQTDVWGIDSHGVSMLMLYDQLLTQGELRFDARPRVVRESAVTALLDAGANLGHPVSVMAMQMAIDKAQAAGIAVVCVRNSHHFGAAGYYARMAPQRGLIGLTTSSARFISVVPTRAAGPVLGTNPIAFAAPAGRNAPFALDMATSTVAANKVKVYMLNERELPAGWVLDERGQTVRDAALAFDYIYHRDAGGLTPVGGTPQMGSHKGYGLGMMAHILSATLAGGAFAPRRREGEADNIAHCFIAIDPKAFRAEGDFEADLDEAIDTLHATPPAEAGRPVLVPGDPELAAQADRLAHGIPLPGSLIDHIRGMCERSGVAFVLNEAPDSQEETTR